MYQRDFVDIIHEVLQLPFEKTPYGEYKKLEATRLYKAIIQALINIASKEPISIQEFGRFYPKYKPAKNQGIGEFKGRKLVGTWVATIPARKTIGFKPCKSLYRSLDDK